MYGVRSRSPSRQPKSSNDFGRRPERLPAGKIEFALSPSHLLPPDMAAASSKRHFREPPNLLPPYRKEWSLLHFELDLLAEERKCMLGRFPAESEALTCVSSSLQSDSCQLIVRWKHNFHQHQVPSITLIVR